MQRVKIMTTNNLLECTTTPSLIYHIHCLRPIPSNITYYPQMRNHCPQYKCYGSVDKWYVALKDYLV